MKNGLMFVIGLVIILLLSTMYIVKEHQVGILFQFSRVQQTDIQPGLHYKWPFIQRVQLFDKRILTLDSQPERYFTSEKKDVIIDFFAKWRIIDAETYYKSTLGNSDNARQRLNPIIKEALRNRINQRTLKETVSDARSSMTKAIVDAVNKEAEMLGILVVDIRIKQIELPQEVSSSVFQRMKEERRRVANELRSEGKEISDTIRSEADRKRTVILAEAQREADTERGVGEAKAAELYADAYNKAPKFYSFYRSLEAYEKSFEDGESTFVLDPDSEFLKYLREGKVNQP